MQALNVKWCDRAVNNMQREPKIYVVNGLIAIVGNCWANTIGFGCMVSVPGTDRNGNKCQITGNNTWGTYQDIRKEGCCTISGNKHFADGCMVSINYVTESDNRDLG